MAFTLQILLATAKAVRGYRMSDDHNCFDLVTHVQALPTLETATNLIIVWLHLTFFCYKE